MYVACREGHDDIVKLLIPLSDLYVNDGDCLLVAIRGKNKEVAKTLLPYFNSPILIERCITYACFRGQDEVLSLLLLKSKSISHNFDQEKIMFSAVAGRSIKCVDYVFDFFKDKQIKKEKVIDMVSQSSSDLTKISSSYKHFINKINSKISKEDLKKNINSNKKAKNKFKLKKI